MKFQYNRALQRFAVLKNSLLAMKKLALQLHGIASSISLEAAEICNNSLNFLTMDVFLHHNYFNMSVIFFNFY